jgi:hypothetical protein
VGKVEIARVVRDSQGDGKRGKPAFGFPRFPRAGFFHSPKAAAFWSLKKTWIIT